MTKTDSPCSEKVHVPESRQPKSKTTTTTTTKKPLKKYKNKWEGAQSFPNFSRRPQPPAASAVTLCPASDRQSFASTSPHTLREKRAESPDLLYRECGETQRRSCPQLCGRQMSIIVARGSSKPDEGGL